MRDGNWQSLMRQKACRERPLVGVGADLRVAEAEYLRGEEMAVCVQPRGVGAAAGWLGLYPDATHVVYLAAPAERLEAGERLSVVAGETALSAASTHGDSEIIVDDGRGFVPGVVVAVGDMWRRVLKVEGRKVTLTSELEHACAVGTPVRRMRRYLVLGSEDEAGQGHHLRVAVREIGG